MYGQAVASSLALKSGSLLILKCSTRRGLSPCAYQMQSTLALLIPTAAARVRVLQCVAFAGRSGVVKRKPRPRSNGRWKVFDRAWLCPAANRPGAAPVTTG